MPNSAHFFMLLKQHNHNQSKNRYQQTSGLLVSRRLEYSLAVTGNKFKTKLLLSRIIYYLPEEIQNRTILQNINIHITCYRVSKLFKHELAYLMVVTKSLNSPPLVYVVTSLISVHPTLHIKLRYHHDTESATLGREGGVLFPYFGYPNEIGLFLHTYGISGRSRIRCYLGMDDKDKPCNEEQEGGSISFLAERVSISSSI